MAQRRIRVVGVIFTLTLLLAMAILLLAMVIPAQAGEVATASVGSDEQLGESGLLCLVIGTGAVLMAVWVWVENMWKLMRPR